jgi:hypothetical protein
VSAARRAPWTLAAALVCSGCFSYVPAALGTVPPGGEVRIHLTSEGVAADLASLGGAESRSVDGTLVRGDRDQLVVRVPLALQATGITLRPLGQDVTIPATRISQLERRQLNRPRTVLASVGGGVALVAALLSFGHGVPDADLPPQAPDDRGLRWSVSLGLP